MSSGRTCATCTSHSGSGRVFLALHAVIARIFTSGWRFRLAGVPAQECSWYVPLFQRWLTIITRSPVDAVILTCTLLNCSFFGSTSGNSANGDIRRVFIRYHTHGGAHDEHRVEVHSQLVRSCMAWSDIRSRTRPIACHGSWCSVNRASPGWWSGRPRLLVHRSPGTVAASRVFGSSRVVPNVPSICLATRWPRGTLLFLRLSIHCWSCWIYIPLRFVCGLL